jgi:hypothetical protein
MRSGRMRASQGRVAQASSPPVFNSSASTRAIIKDHLQARMMRLRRVSEVAVFTGVCTESSLLELTSFEVSRANDRTHNRSGSSLGYNIDAVPGPVSALVSSVRS